MSLSELFRQRPPVSPSERPAPKANVEIRWPGMMQCLCPGDELPTEIGGGGSEVPAFVDLPGAHRERYPGGGGTGGGSHNPFGPTSFIGQLLPQGWPRGGISPAPAAVNADSEGPPKGDTQSSKPPRPFEVVEWPPRMDLRGSSSRPEIGWNPGSPVDLDILSPSRAVPNGGASPAKIIERAGRERSEALEPIRIFPGNVAVSQGEAPPTMEQASMAVMTLEARRLSDGRWQSIGAQGSVRPNELVQLKASGVGRALFTSRTTSFVVKNQDGLVVFTGKASVGVNDGTSEVEFVPQLAGHYTVTAQASGGSTVATTSFTVSSLAPTAPDPPPRRSLNPFSGIGGGFSGFFGDLKLLAFLGIAGLVTYSVAASAASSETSRRSRSSG